MEKLFPIASKATRHLFVDPAVSRPTFVKGEGYVSGEMTSFIKPGKVPNLALLAQPEDTKFTVTEEPNIDTLAVTDILFGARDHQGTWQVCLVKGVNAKLTKDGPSRSILQGHIVIHPDSPVSDGIFGDKIVNLGDQPTAVPIELMYERGTRALTLKEIDGVGYDSGKPQVLGIKLNLDWIDSRIVK